MNQNPKQKGNSMKSRINIFFSAILLLVTVPTMQAMKPVKSATRAAAKKVSHWKEAIENALTGATPTTVVITQLNTAPANPLSNPGESDFNRLPQHERRQIIFLLNQFGSSNNLSSIGQVINSLAQVNKELNALINNPKVYFDMSRNLARQLDVSNEEVAKALQTEQAKREWALQQNLVELCWNRNNLNELQIGSLLLQFINMGVDLNFTYKNTGTPLNIAIYANPDLALGLVEAGANLNITDSENNTPLMAAKLTGNNELAQAIEEKLNQKK